MNITVIGYGKLGQSAARQIVSSEENKLSGIITRRNPEDIPGFETLPFYSSSQTEEVLAKTDVALVCTSSESDTMRVTAQTVSKVCVVDCFDDHTHAAEHIAAVNAIAEKSKTTAVLCAGWDPGYFSVLRLFGEAFLPYGASYTFWGPGTSAGHSAALRRLTGSELAVQKTVPLKSAVRIAENGYIIPLSAKEMHRRVCYLDTEKSPETEKEIRSLRGYFDGYDTRFHYVSHDELIKLNEDRSHAGHVYRCGKVDGKRALMKASLLLTDNQAFTAAVMLSYARAVYIRNANGIFGAFTPFDIAPKELLPDQNALRFL